MTKRPPIPMKPVKDYHEGYRVGAGAFFFNEDGNLVIRTPDGSFMRWNITNPEIRPYWIWDGNREKPTLTPSLSISCSKGECWHGYVSAGELVSV